MSEPFICHECGFETDDPVDLSPLRNHDERVMPGEIEPAGECPHCGGIVQCPDTDIPAETLNHIAEVMRKRGWTVLQPEVQ
jgi:predicted RNA-binding Zn-ribbon protein involved in translation (DUF1610 family)